MFRFNRYCHADLSGALSPVMLVCGGLIVALLAVSVAGSASAACPTCADQHWSAEEKLDQMGNPDWTPDVPSGTAPQAARQTEWGVTTGLNDDESSDDTPEASSAGSQASVTPATGSAATRSDVSDNLAALSGEAVYVTPAKVSRSDVVLDVSDFGGSAESYVDGAVHIDYTEFLDEYKAPKSIGEISQILGDAGISSDDSVVLVGTCEPCGGVTIHPVTFTYWVMKYLGHDNVKILDGGIGAWIDAGLAVQSTPSTRPATVYTATNPRPSLLANYDYVNSQVAQIVDARSFQDFATNKIPGAVSVPYEQVLSEDSIKDVAALSDIFAMLDKDRPVVVYTNTGVWASIPWLALTMAGYDARLYSYKDWYDNQPTLDVDLEGARAEPNPSAPGPVNIYATFGQGDVVEEAPAGEPVETSSSEDATQEAADPEQTKLVTMGCVTCEPITVYTGGTFGTDKSRGVQLAPSFEKTSGDDFTCQARVADSDGVQVATVEMSQVEGDEYVGTWNAEEPGLYGVTIVATASGVSKAFEDALHIEITGDTTTVN